MVNLDDELSSFWCNGVDFLKHQRIASSMLMTLWVRSGYGFFCVANGAYQGAQLDIKKRYTYIRYWMIVGWVPGARFFFCVNMMTILELLVDNFLRTVASAFSNDNIVEHSNMI